ncbi:hypothetical protein Tco_1500562 [Tanacetum coccineum]
MRRLGFDKVGLQIGEGKPLLSLKEINQPDYGDKNRNNVKGTEVRESNTENVLPPTCKGTVSNEPPVPVTHSHWKNPKSLLGTLNLIAESTDMEIRLSLAWAVLDQSRCLDIIVACDMGCLDIVATCSTGCSMMYKILMGQEIASVGEYCDTLAITTLLPMRLYLELEEDVHVLKLFNRTTKVEYYRMLQNCCIGLSSTTTHFVETIVIRKLKIHCFQTALNEIA